MTAIAAQGKVARLAQWLRVIIGACLALSCAAAPAQTPEDNFKKILPAIQLLLLSGENRRGVYNIFTDHLNTPRLITNNVGQPVWRYDNSDPFGGNTPDENPSSLGTFEFPLRDAGTYFDNETGLIYNWNRYRDLNAGRFIQADPLGFDGGGLSLYLLRSNNPLSFTDPQGLIPIAPPILACATNPACVTLVAGTVIATGNAIIGTINALNTWSVSSSSGTGYSKIATSLQLVCGPNEDDPCDELHRIDTDTCNAITRRRGAAAGAICHASAGQRLGECRRFGIGGVTTPLTTWNN